RSSRARLVASSSVASTSSQMVASGISWRDFDRRSDTTFRSPVIGVRVSRSPAGPAAGPAAGAGSPAEAVPGPAVEVADVPAGTCGDTVASDSIAARTSALVTTPPAPLPGRCLALIPWSFASLRTSGDDTGETCRSEGGPDTVEVGPGTVEVSPGSAAFEVGAPAVPFAGRAAPGSVAAEAGVFRPNERSFDDRAFGSEVP